MRPIHVSTDVFAMIWATRKPGEDTEDVILRRVLSGGKAKAMPQTVPSPDNQGFYDRRYDVLFREDFEIFRTYLGKEYRARATAGSWLLANNGQRYGGLNELSQAIGTKTENAWVNWFFLDDGQKSPVSALRSPARI